MPTMTTKRKAATNTGTLFAPTPPALPSEDEMYRAVAERDDAYAGVFIVAVKTTGIFCRPGCGAKVPRRENVEFFPRPIDAATAGYRACKRCSPLEPAHAVPEWAAKVIKLAETHAGQRLTGADLRRVDVDPARAARWFKSRFGVTFQGYHRALRLGRAAQASAGLLKARGVRGAATAAGFDSESGFRDALANLFGTTPAQASTGAGRLMAARWLSTPLGSMIAVARDHQIVMLEFADRRALMTQLRSLRARVPGAIIPAGSPALDKLEAQLAEYFAGTRLRFDLPLHKPGTPFQAAVWERLAAIPPGTTSSYADIARALGRPTATRAVATANGDNRLAILLPCHRVIGSDGSLTGYAGGLWRKQWLLDHEKRHERA
jgi:AraC family transcriptional regulator of adaptative response/methylated-DNA-[protein]-cysteine methyltransferase